MVAIANPALRTVFEYEVMRKLDRLMKFAFSPVFGRAFRPMFDAGEAEAAVSWWLSGGISLANVLAAHQPLGAASLAASYDDIAHAAPTWDAAPGVAPTFDTSYGWYFDGTKYLNVGNDAIVSGVPLTVIVLFNSDNVTGYYGLANVGNYSLLPVATEGFQLIAAGSVAGDYIRALTFQASTFGLAVSTSGYTATTWYVAAAVYSSISARAAFLNGTNKGTNTTSKTPGTINRTAIGAVWTGGADTANKFKGKIAADAWYNIALDDAQVLAVSNALLALVA